MTSSLYEKVREEMVREAIERARSLKKRGEEYIEEHFFIDRGVKAWWTSYLEGVNLGLQILAKKSGREHIPLDSKTIINQAYSR